MSEINEIIDDLPAGTQSPPKVSVIVPVYKVERYLPECIESILAQTFTDFELILVDDGSPDNSGKICDDYAARDSRIRVFHKENGGVSSARNLGLDNARGEWIAFVDSDDWVEKDFLEKYFDDKDDVDVVLQGHAIFDDFSKQYIPRESFPSCSCFGIEEMWDVICQNDLLNSTGPCCKLFSRSILENNKIRFPEGFSLGEDAVFVFKYWKCSKSFRLVSTLKYFYRKNISGNASLCVRKHSVEQLLESSNVWYNVAQDLLDAWEKGNSFYGKDILSTAIYRHRTRAIAQVLKKNCTWREKIHLVKVIIGDNDLAKTYFPRSRRGKMFKLILRILQTVS